MPDRSGKCRVCGLVFTEAAEDEGPPGFQKRREASEPAEGWRREAGWDWEPPPPTITLPSQTGWRGEVWLEHLRTGGTIALMAVPFFLAAIPVALLELLRLVSLLVGRRVYLGEFLAAVQEVGLAPVFYGGLLMLVLFTLITLALGFSMRSGSELAAAVAAILGVVMAGLSMLILALHFGALLSGSLGMVGGGFLLAGGVVGALEW
jgi:hypothetical protein